ncbi:MAG: Branched-chain amino acid transporter, amino acid-binding protein [Patescibacteria group bacterium]|jgi:hypothetical protein|nr:Branched-chain amino acid transporter, amino acid-binding protein [Patescibacteria group bacterium]
MEGPLSYTIKKGIILCVIAVLSLTSVTLPLGLKKVQAIQGLEFAQDTLNGSIASAEDIEHSITFILPVNSVQIKPSDWIFVNLHNFLDVTAPTYVVGAFGTPTFAVNGSTVSVTNIAVLPGTRLAINGVTATTPASSQSREVTITVAEDSAGTIIRNQVTIIAGDNTAMYTVGATVENQMSSVNLSGFTAPGNFLFLNEGGSTLGTSSADGAGNFSFPISGLNPGDHIFRIFATDQEGRSTSQSVIQLYLLPNTLTTATGILLSPTISLDESEIEAGDTLTVSGTAKPSSQINIFVESPLHSYLANTDAQGNWSYLIPASETLNYTPGEYRVYTNVQDGSGNQSIVSPTANFQVISPEDADNPPPDCDISEGDLNCDGLTNLIDFSILLFHWNSNHKVADINSDQEVNLIDFSIMMFYFAL